MAIEALASEIAVSILGQTMRSSAWAYPLANVAHLFGLAVLAGGIMAVDLRIMGFWQRLPLKPMHDALTPLAIAGLFFFTVSGVALFAADAKDLVNNSVFLAKMIVVTIAIANALLFRKVAGERLGDWNVRAPFVARLSAAMSLSLWSGAIICGRMIAY